MHHNRAGRDAVAVGDITNLQLDEIAGPQLAIDAKVEQRQFPSSSVNLKPDAYRPNFLNPSSRIGAKTPIRRVLNQYFRPKGLHYGE